MIRIYCRAHHAGSDGLCRSCEELFAYARQRIEKCPFGTDKPVCNTCPVHCYLPERQKRIKEVMRYAGPRMLRTHPLLAIRHLLRSKRYSGMRSK